MKLVMQHCYVFYDLRKLHTTFALLAQKRVPDYWPPSTRVKSVAHLSVSSSCIPFEGCLWMASWRPVRGEKIIFYSILRHKPSQAWYLLLQEQPLLVKGWSGTLYILANYCYPNNSICYRVQQPWCWNIRYIFCSLKAEQRAMLTILTLVGFSNIYSFSNKLQRFGLSGRCIAESISFLFLCIEHSARFRRQIYKANHILKYG